MSEDKLQAECHLWAWNNHPALRRLFMAIPNSGKRSLIEGAMMKAKGTVAGAPDYLLTRTRPVPDYLFMELKTDTGKLSEYQKQMQAVHGYRYIVIRSLAQFQEVFMQFYFYQQM